MENPECWFCNKPLRTNTRIAFVFFKDIAAPYTAHWTCCAGHNNPNLIAIRRDKLENRPASLDTLSQGKLTMAKTLAKRTKDGKIKGTRSRTSGMAGSAYGFFPVENF